MVWIYRVFVCVMLVMIYFRLDNAEKAITYEINDTLEYVYKHIDKRADDIESLIK
ncbi:hypothetical protein [Campylobacter sp. RM16192]|uniref:hypothetical protein n=1 Tax=Campylobacter sp. RM16192 TaxID=1660080 RepID=UPI0014516B61|nr:hypothetical protein [Campylobacter sp. RM16192]QCD52802.1 hypothetical protein CDOMC_1195 [Campylobacter sp. RM16192]